MGKTLAPMLRLFCQNTSLTRECFFGSGLERHARRGLRGGARFNSTVPKKDEVGPPVNPSFEPQTGSNLHIIAKLISSQHLNAINFGPRRFGYLELKVAINDYLKEQLLGRGGCGSVHQGAILQFANQNGTTPVAIKRMAKNSKKGEREFHAEVLSIGRLRHRNLASLLGWCHERDELLLVYEFSPAMAVQVPNPARNHLRSRLPPQRVGEVNPAPLRLLLEGSEKDKKTSAKGLVRRTTRSVKAPFGKTLMLNNRAYVVVAHRSTSAAL